MALDWFHDLPTPCPVLRIDEACDRFEDAWQSATDGPPPRIEDFLRTASGPERIALLRELLALDVEYRRDCGEMPAADDYLHRFPDQADYLHTLLNRSISDTPADGNSLGRELLNTVPPAAVAGETGLPLPRIRGYDILGLLGTGGMGVVYRARQLLPPRVVALKTIRAGLFASPADVERFHSEAASVAGLDHEHIVPIYEVGQDGGLHFFSMKLMEGGSLASAEVRSQELGDSKDSQRKAALLMAKVARAVHYAHQRGILHRDLKPANILLDGRGQPHVADFGLAKRVESEGSLTQSGAIVGTPAFIAPEQAAGRKGRLTTTVDVYGLGAILYQLLTGQAPFSGTTPVNTVLHVLEREPERPRRLNPEVNPDLETVCLKCLEKDPARRYGSAEALAEDLERWLAGEPIRARRASAWERAIKWARRRPAAAALAIVSAAAALSLVVLLGALWRNAEERAATVQQLSELEEVAAAKRAEVQRLERLTRQEVEKARQAQLAGRRALYTRDIQLAWTAQGKRETQRLFQLLNQHDPPPGGPDLRNFEWHHLWLLCHHELLVLTGHRRNIFSGTFAEDGRALLTADRSGRVRAWDVTTGKERPLPELAGTFCAGAVSPTARTQSPARQMARCSCGTWPPARARDNSAPTRVR